MERPEVVFTTERGTRHQKKALDAAPESLTITMLRQPPKAILLTHLATAEYWISERVGVIDAEMIQAAPNLKLILRLGSLTFDIDLEAAQGAGLAVCYWPIGSVIRVAEHCIMQMLVLSRQLRHVEAVARQAGSRWGSSRRTDEDTFAYNWSDRQNIHGLWRQHVGILGFGEVGAELARRLRTWGCSVCYHKRRRLPERVEDDLGVMYADLDTLLNESNHVVNLLPYSIHTDLWFDAKLFARMKHGAYLSSCGSGSVINEDDLAAAIKSGHLAGAALDTFEWEPIRRENPLIRLAESSYNVLLTPHTAAGATAVAEEERQQDYHNVLAHMRGEPVRYRLV
jgi:phosphoglycerate dehydrogenase-like enzyme